MKRSEDDWRVEDRQLDGWGIVSIALILPAFCLTAFAIGLTVIAILDAIQQEGAVVADLMGFVPDLFVAWAGAVGAWWSVVLAGRRSRV